MFTKGKWEAVRDRSSRHWNVVSGDANIALITNHCKAQPEANARLIAAAPQMFEALEWISKVFHSEGLISEGDIGRVDRAIAAAKGE